MKNLLLISGLFFFSTSVFAQNGVIKVKKNQVTEFEKVMREEPRRGIEWRHQCVVLIGNEYGSLQFLFGGGINSQSSNGNFGISFKSLNEKNRLNIQFKREFQSQLNSLHVGYQFSLLNKNKWNHTHNVLSVGLDAGIGLGGTGYSQVSPYFGFKFPNSCLLNRFQLNAAYNIVIKAEGEVSPMKNGPELSLWFYL